MHKVCFEKQSSLLGTKAEEWRNVGSWLELGGGGAMVRAVSILFVLLLFVAYLPKLVHLLLDTGLGESLEALPYRFSFSSGVGRINLIDDRFQSSGNSWARWPEVVTFLGITWIDAICN